jgi:hypothetical protein
MLRIMAEAAFLYEYFPREKRIDGDDDATRVSGARGWNSWLLFGSICLGCCGHN